MTLSLLSNIGIEFDWKDNIITILPQYAIKNKTIVVESDWSSASYFYSLVALKPNSEIQLASYRKNSLQGDADLFTIYKKLGVQTIFKENTIILKNVNIVIPKNLELDLSNTPDLAQTIAVTCFGLGISCKLIGLHTLKIKETDRLVALKTEIEKLGGNVSITDNSIQVFSSAIINKNISITTYHDHRMAMAFAPLALKVPIQIENPEVVSKSYPDFWSDFDRITT
jgi:3-phosphoshikimate 1-carboxyvinyltransferase